MKWKQKISELGFQETTVSKSIKSKIKDFYTMQEAIADLKERIANPSEDDDIEEMKSEYEEYQNTIVMLDDDIVETLINYDKNKEANAERVRKMREGKEKKAQGGYQQPKVADTAKSPTPPAPAPNPTPNPAPNANNGEGEKKKSGFGWMAFTLLAGVVTLGAWWTMKKD